MRKHSKLAVVGLVASLLMALAVSSASANHLSVSNQNYRIVWTELNLLNGPNGSVIDRCHVTLEGTFHSATIAKVSDSLIGYITRASLASCTTGTTILTATLPWHVRYRSFSGTLPNILSIRLLLETTAFQVNTLGVVCLYKGNGVEVAEGEARIGAGGAITGLSADPSVEIPKFSGGALCPASGAFSGTGSVTVLGSTAGITVRLI